MNIITILLLLGWLACGLFVFLFVRRTGGFTKIGKVAHWFGGTFVMIGLAAGMTFGYARLEKNFGTRVNVYLLTHQIRPEINATFIQKHAGSSLVTVYRPGSVNRFSNLVDGRLIIDEEYTVNTSWWWMLWDTKYR